MQAFAVLKQNRMYLALTAGIFLFGWVLGGMFPQEFLSVIQGALSNLQEIAEKTKEQDSAAYTSWVIFLNNLRASVIMLVMGIPFAFLTCFSLLFNGVTIGVVFDSIGASGATYWEAILFGLLPHGVFELTAIFIMGGLGIKYGRVLAVPLRDKTRWQSFVHVTKEVLHVSWLVLALLVVAAAVEGTITPYLLETFVRS